MQMKVPEEALKYHTTAHALLLQTQLGDCPRNAPVYRRTFGFFRVLVVGICHRL
jgi:hypothetical protein